MSVRVHHWLYSDDDRAVHDHPWWFVTLVLRGSYVDISDAHDRLRPGSVRFRPATHRHIVKVDAGGVWTVMVTGRKVRRWGFWPNGKFKKANKYFLEYGLAPCQELEGDK